MGFDPWSMYAMYEAEDVRLEDTEPLRRYVVPASMRHRRRCGIQRGHPGEIVPVARSHICRSRKERMSHDS
jgi:hypothetical protein